MMFLRNNKYKVSPVAARTVCGKVFASKAEATRYMELKLLQQAGVITDLKTQVPFPFDIAGVHICTYRADFTYYEKGGFVVEEVKGCETPVWKLKERLFHALYPSLNLRVLHPGS